MAEPSRRSRAVALAVALAMPAEGLRQIAYRDPVGIPTICFGSTKGVKMGDTATIDQCKALLTEEMIAAVVQVEKCVPDAPVPVLAAFADAVYNMGPSIACNTHGSTAARLLKAGDWTAACQQLASWNKAKVAGVFVPLPGLAKRRKAEEELCLSHAFSG
ncbi:Glycoside hydrolase, family 24 [uncultured Caudovirales phage]|uniref:Endolysin n=1 Tax=uncultured Caudovirales phage TaxID=2100421 RepID=A0A6J5LQ31_9CAUD|nr:Glycoside hydrolase, family 24 [uncultured Caudovirales phage]CAB4135016.1 COG3772 Phage-related lysozyme (muraminidase) [uncultured Caudovirales phage]